MKGIFRWVTEKINELQLKENLMGLQYHDGWMEGISDECLACIADQFMMRHVRLD